MKRYEKLVLGDDYMSLPTVFAGEYAETLSVYTDEDGNKAVVPPGWTVSGAEKENIIWGQKLGLVIYRIPKEKVGGINWSVSNVLEKLQRTFDQLVWTPVSLLQANGTLDGEAYIEKFGRRHFKIRVCNEFIREPLVGDLALEKESIDRYGGYYSSRYHISKDPKTQKPRSVKGVYPWVNISESITEVVAKTFVEGEGLSTHLTYGAEYDTREEWVRETKTMDLKEIVEDATKWGNYCNTMNSPGALAKTGSCEKWCCNNIYDCTGNVSEWTQEKFIGDSNCIIRGGYYLCNGSSYPMDFRNYTNIHATPDGTGFRVTLCIK